MKNLTGTVQWGCSVMLVGLLLLGFCGCMESPTRAGMISGPQPSAAMPNPATPIVCNKLDIVAQLQGTTLDIRLDTDLPDFTQIMVSVSRNYREKGDSESRYPRDYFSEKSTVRKWRTSHAVSVADQVFRDALQKQIDRLAEVGCPFEVADVEDTIYVSITVPINQANSAFGPKNINLKGDMLAKKGLRVVHGEVAFTKPLDDPAYLGTVPKKAQFARLDVGETLITRSSAPAAPDFRNVSWGMSKAEVQAIETASPTAGADVPKDQLWYQTEFGNVSVFLAYFFVDDKLSTAGYQAPHGQTSDLYVKDIDRITNALTQEYGEPAAVGKARNEHFAGMANQTTWVTETTSIAVISGTLDSRLTAIVGCARSIPEPLTDRAEEKIKDSSTPQVLPDTVTNSIGMELVPIPAGEFTMGSPRNGIANRDECPQHRVRITQPFYLSVHEVTQEQYENVMGENPSHFKGPTLPVETVSWDDAVEFCHRLSQTEGRKYRLPTEAEWEYACRAGTTTRCYWNDSDGQISDHVWYTGNANRKTHPVGEKRPNTRGLFDMNGNVSEWCQDWYADYDTNSSDDDPTGPATGSRRVFRGSGWGYGPGACRSSYRSGYPPGGRLDFLGFRVAQVSVE